MTEGEILDEIRRIHDEDGGVPGLAPFMRSHPEVPATAFKGLYWTSWNDAVRSAGLTPNDATSAIDQDELFRALADLTRELGHFPTLPEMRLRRRNGTLPVGVSAIQRFGTKQEQIEGLRAWCNRQPGFADVVQLCGDPGEVAGDAHEGPPSRAGYVYLLRSPTRGYKIGLTRSTPQRWARIQQEDPEEVELIHYFKTVDPEGIEAYWHGRFDAQRKDRGEWFDLSREQVAEFKRRTKSM